MNIEMVLVANSFFLIVILLVLIMVLVRNGEGNGRKKTKIKEDIEKIKEQIDS
jgi:uncharacterized membrane-anchored protein YhcB (DUF1043 family)